MKVEKALRVLPPTEAMTPVRALLLASGFNAAGAWPSMGTNGTLGKRDVAAEELRDRMTQEFQRVVAHVSALYDAYFNVLQALDTGVPESAVASLLGAGRREEKAGRVEQAHVWYRVSLEVAEQLADRKPEIETLLAIGKLTRSLGYFDESTRRYRRALVLAESEFDQAAVMSACDGLGTLLMDQAAWSGAEAWFARGMRLAERIQDSAWIGTLFHRQGELLRRRGDPAAALEPLTRARERFESLGDAIEVARTLTTRGLADADLRHAPNAAAAYREALAWVRTAKGNDSLEVFIRLSFAQLHVDEGRFLEAEEQIRRAERLAVANNLLRRLVQLYTLLGNLRARQGDDSGFVFFEQALQLARMLERRPMIEARVYHEYGMFKLLMHQPEDAKAYLRRAREMFESVGLDAEAERVVADLRRASA